MDNLQKLAKEIGHERMTLKSSIIDAAKEYTGLDTSGVKTLLKKARAVNKAFATSERLKKKEKFGFSSLQSLRENENKAANLLSYFSTSYSMGEVKKINLIVDGKPELFYGMNNTRQYSGKYRGSETYGFISLTFTKREWNALVRINHVWTITRPNTNRCFYFEQHGEKQHHRIEKIDGYCIEGSHGRTEKDALEILEQRKIAEAERAQKEAQEKAYKESLREKAKRTFVGLQDIKNVGACTPGIRSFAQRYQLSLEYGYRLDYLISLEPNNSFLNSVLWK